MKRRTMTKVLSATMAAAMMASTVCVPVAAEAEGDRPYYVREADKVTGKLTVYTTMEETQPVLRSRQTPSELWQQRSEVMSLQMQML